jgi:nucleoside-diphosphate-sugar epimerase
LTKKILIVGGTGFLGYHLAKKCLERGWNVISISTSKPKKIRFLSKVKYLILDISKKKNFRKLINYKFDYVVNFGGYVNHSEKRKTYQSHFIGCKNLVDFFLYKNLKSFIQIGSCVEYGNYKSPQKESKSMEIKKLKSIYGKAKLSATNYLLKKFRENKFPCTILRLYLVYGPKQDFNRYIPLVIRGCLENSKFPCSKGNQFRDFLYVDDLVRAIFKCLKNRNSKGEIFNIGSGVPREIKKITLFIQSIINKGKPEFGKIPFRKDEIINLYPSIDKAKKIINWKPHFDFKNSTLKTIKYYKKLNVN